ncbi:MAG: tRNA preQ1(34) S-adenosylmethionine ribosyltransferase-isomerase QueA [Clostridia bacterium]|nr:tRNA preQ1(34) S-adenosylmethionine ribosyltransferase-isomerase QueA [Clostridia bacterium]
MKKSDFFYNLPEELIAQHPSEKRDMSRLLVLDSKTGAIEHRNFYNITEYLDEGDCLVINDTRVIPARLLGTSEKTGGGIEFVLLKKIDGDDWEVLARPGKKALPGKKFVFGGGIMTAEVIGIARDGNRVVRLAYDGIFEEALDKAGVLPLPPYITEKLMDTERYQTVYSRVNGSAAAPTAGLHFTEELIQSISEAGVSIAKVTLHVGLGTFRPVKTENLTDHFMHSEYYEISREAADIINKAKLGGKRIISVGTTSSRVIESVADSRGFVSEGMGETDIFIYPGYRFKSVDCLITNFHLPESTLLMMVSALAGRENVLRAYEEAIAKKYRFFSFGDAMFIK